jgi:hypothetical protein
VSWPGARESLVNSASSPMLISSFSGPSGRVGSAAWALWGVVSARAQVEAIEMGDVAFAPDFEYLVRKGDNRRSDFLMLRSDLLYFDQLYALERVKMFRREIAELGISLE